MSTRLKPGSGRNYWRTNKLGRSERQLFERRTLLSNDLNPQETERNPFVGSAQFGAAPVAQDMNKKEVAPQMSNQMLDSLKGYLENIVAAATQTAANGGPPADLEASLAVSGDTVVRQQLEIKRITKHINALEKKGGAFTNGVPGTGGNNFPPFNHCGAVGQTAPQRHKRCYFE